MSIKASYEFLFIGRDEDSFLENYSYDLFEEHGEKSGQIFINVEIQNNPVDAEEIGVAIYDVMQQAFFQNLELDAYERFEHALKEVNRVLHSFEEEKRSGYIGDLNVIIAAIHKKNLYLTQTGEAEAYLIRKRFVSVISEGLNEDDDSGDIFVNIASGTIEPGDFVLFSTTRLLRYIGKTDLARSVRPRRVDATLAEIRDVVSTEILGRISLIGMSFSNIEKEELNGVKTEEGHVEESLLKSDGNLVSAEKNMISGEFVSDVETRGRPKKSISKKANFLVKLVDKVNNGGVNKGRFLIFLLFIIVLLTIGIVVAKNNSVKTQEVQAITDLVEQTQVRIDEADTKKVTDKNAARSLLKTAETDTRKILASGYYRDKGNVFLSEIEEIYDDIDNVMRVEEFDSVLDINTFASGFAARGIVEVADRLFVFNNGAVREILIDRLGDEISLENENGIIDAIGFDDRSSLLFLTEAGEIIEYVDGNISYVDTEEGNFKKAVAFDDWSKNVYLLDEAGNQIWKYVYQNNLSNFSSSQPYISEGADFAGSKDLAIDSSIYYLYQDGRIGKLYAGEKVNDFAVENDPEIKEGEAGMLFTNEKIDRVYVLYPEEARLFIYLKDERSGNLNYEKQLYFEGLEGQVKDFYVDPDDLKVHLVDSNKVYQIGS